MDMMMTYSKRTRKNTPTVGYISLAKISFFSLHLIEHPHATTGVLVLWLLRLLSNSDKKPAPLIMCVVFFFIAYHSKKMTTHPSTCLAPVKAV